jgi:hypothetical protein
MKPTEFWRWTVPHAHKPGKTSTTRWRMTESDALAQYPTATKVPGSMEIRQVPETEAEGLSQSTTALSQRLKGWQPP